jgi:hypothetical protein
VKGNQVTWLLENQRFVNRGIAFISPFRAQLLDRDGVKLVEVQFTLDPGNSMKGERNRATLKLPADYEKKTRSIVIK